MTPADFAEFLKLRGWRAFFIGVAAFAVVLASKWTLLPDLGSWWIAFAAGGGISMALAMASGAEWLTEKLTERKARNQAKIQAEKTLEDHRQKFIRDIPRFDKIERDIFGYLRINNQNTLTASMDGDLAASLLGRGYIKMSVLRGQQIDVTAAPFIIPEHIWEIIVSRPDDFPYEDDRGNRRRMPWHSP